MAVLELLVDENGRVVSACVLRAVRSDFDKAAQEAALRWRFKPASLRSGQAVGTVTTVTVATPGGDQGRQ